MLEEFRRFSDVSVETLREMSPLLMADEGKKYPPILILHGDQDQIVHYDQSVRFYEKLKVAGSEEEGERKKIVEAYERVMTNGLGLLGIKVPEEM